MLKRVSAAFASQPLVYNFFSSHVRMQLEDVGAMLRLPLRACGLDNGCNFATASVICNLISGVSVTIYQPAVYQKPTKKGKREMIGCGDAFRAYVTEFYPDSSPDRRSEIADVLYKQLRNPFAHALGVLAGDAHPLEIVKVTSTYATNKGDGLTRAEVAAIEESPLRACHMGLGVQGSGDRWKIIVDSLYRDVLDMMVALGYDSAQMERAEARFQEGIFAWRS